MGYVRPLLGSVACFAILSCTSKAPPDAQRGAATAALVTPDPAVVTPSPDPAGVTPDLAGVLPDLAGPGAADAAAAIPGAVVVAEERPRCAGTRMGCMNEERTKKNRVQVIPKPAAK